MRPNVANFGTGAQTLFRQSFALEPRHLGKLWVVISATSSCGVFCHSHRGADGSRDNEDVSRVFLLSPANASGVRGRMLLNERSEFDLAVRLRSEGALLGDVFAFISGLYFRGKVAYSSAFAAPPPGVSASLVITAGRGLLPPATRIAFGDMRSIADVPIDLANPLYRNPLERDATSLFQAIPRDCDVVLLGSIATSKYLEPLIGIFGSRLLFPSDFVGRGDMSRGGLMLRCAREGTELNYLPAHAAVRRGARPPRLAKLNRSIR